MFDILVIIIMKYWFWKMNLLIEHIASKSYNDVVLTLHLIYLTILIMNLYRSIYKKKFAQNYI